jgi:beta-glucosidase
LPLTKECEALIPPSPTIASTPRSALNEPRWTERFDALRAEAQTTSADVLLIGDSIFARWRPAWWAGSMPGLTEFNIGIDGDRTDTVLWRVTNGNLPAKPPRLIILLIGTNNTAKLEQSPETIAGGIATIAKTLRSSLPTSRLLIVGTLPRGRGLDDPITQHLRRTNALIAKCADDRAVFYVDASKGFLTGDGTISAELMPDLLHPSQRGYEVLAGAIRAAIERMKK